MYFIVRRSTFLNFEVLEYLDVLRVQKPADSPLQLVLGSDSYQFQFPSNQGDQKNRHIPVCRTKHFNSIVITFTD